MPDPDELAEMAALVEQLAETTAEIRDRGERADVPAVERNAARLAGVIEQLERNLPPELFDG